MAAHPPVPPLESVPAAGDDPETQDALERQRLIADSAEAFARAQLPLARARDLRNAACEFDPGVMRAVAGQGWTGMLVPESLGGFGLGVSDLRPVVQTFAAHLAPEPIVAVAVVAAGLLSHCEAAGRRDDLLTSLLEGRCIPGVAWQFPCGMLPDMAAPFKATREGTEWRVSGAARFVRPGSGSTVYLLLAHAPEGPMLMECPLEMTGLRVAREAQADGTSLLRVQATEVRIPEDRAWRLTHSAIAQTLHQALVMTAAELLGLMSRMRLMTLEYLKTRVQFGRPIGSFQALQHRAVDMLLQEELAAAVVEEAATAVDHGASLIAAGLLSSRAKARAAHAALHIAKESIQMHGGIGVTDEYDLSLYVNRTLALAPWLGNASAHRERFGLLDQSPPTSDPRATA